jgi:hypothetical protein
MKKIFAGICMVLVLTLLMWGVPKMFPDAGAATTATVTSKGDVATGTIVSDSAGAVNVSVGFTPSKVLITKTTTTFAQAYWVTGMAAGSCLKTAGTGTNGYAQTTMAVMSMPTVSCISAYAGSTSAAPGFTMGPDLDINVNGQTLRWEAHR